MDECGASLQTFPEETLPTASWPWTVTLTPHTFRNLVGKYWRWAFKTPLNQLKRQCYTEIVHRFSIVFFLLSSFHFLCALT